MTSNKAPLLIRQLAAGLLCRRAFTESIKISKVILTDEGECYAVDTNGEQLAAKGRISTVGVMFLDQLAETHEFFYQTRGELLLPMARELFDRGLEIDAKAKDDAEPFGVPLRILSVVVTPAGLQLELDENKKDNLMESRPEYVVMVIDLLREVANDLEKEFDQIYDEEGNERPEIVQ